MHANLQDNRRNIFRIVVVIAIILVIIAGAFALGIRNQTKVDAKPAPVVKTVQAPTPKVVTCKPLLDIQFNVGTQLKVLSAAKQYLRYAPVADLSVNNVRVNLAQGVILIVNGAPKCIAKRLWYPVTVANSDIIGWAALTGPIAKDSTDEILLLDLVD